MHEDRILGRAIPADTDQSGIFVIIWLWRSDAQSSGKVQWAKASAR